MAISIAKLFLIQKNNSVVIHAIIEGKMNINSHPNNKNKNQCIKPSPQGFILFHNHNSTRVPYPTQID
jgi:hypothetical protein